MEPNKTSTFTTGIWSTFSCTFLTSAAKPGHFAQPLHWKNMDIMTPGTVKERSEDWLVCWLWVEYANIRAIWEVCVAFTTLNFQSEYTRAGTHGCYSAGCKTWLNTCGALAVSLKNNYARYVVYLDPAWSSLFLEQLTHGRPNGQLPIPLTRPAQIKSHHMYHCFVMWVIMCPWWANERKKPLWLWLCFPQTLRTPWSHLLEAGDGRCDCFKSETYKRTYFVSYFGSDFVSHVFLIVSYFAGVSNLLTRVLKC
jgi:hypothetical protein